MGWRIAALVLLLFCATSSVAAPVSISLGPSVVALNGPWKFRTGDDARWADPAFDDSNWETIDLTPAPGAHDSDVGLRNFVPGWSKKGHHGYTGFAWYRLTLRVAEPGSEALWLVAPADVDIAYQLFFNGHLVGGIGDFSRHPAIVFAIQPRLFKLPRALWTIKDGEWNGVVAVRVVLEPGSLLRSQTDSGGIHIAPLLGTEKGAGDHYRMQWLQMVEGYTVDAVEPIALLILAIMALSLMPFDPKDRFYPWLAVALVLLGVARANQPFYFLAQIETMHEFGFWRVVVIDGLTFAAWTMAWRSAFGQQSSRWVAVAAGALAIVYMIARFLTLKMFFPGVPHGLAAPLAIVQQLTRLGFLCLMLYLAIRGVMVRAPALWLAMASFVCVSVGLFALELTEIGVPGIWFPYGIGVSLSEYAYAAFDVAMFFCLLQRLWSYAPTAARRGSA
jgi:hypothetical protein